QRTVLASLGVALGIGALTALSGAAASNQAQLLAELDRMGANLAIVTATPGPDDVPVPLPQTAPAMIGRVDGVAEVGVFETAPEDGHVYRTDLVPATETNGLDGRSGRPPTRLSCWPSSAAWVRTSPSSPPHRAPMMFPFLSRRRHRR